MSNNDIPQNPSLQKLINYIIPLLLQQSRKSVDNDGLTCLYRGPHGTKCAVGHVIADEHYSVELESKDVNHHLVLQALARSMGQERVTGAQKQLLRELQVCHDFAERDCFVSDFRGELGASKKEFEALGVDVSAYL